MNILTGGVVDQLREETLTWFIEFPCTFPDKRLNRLSIKVFHAEKDIYKYFIISSEDRNTYAKLVEPKL
jgi:hypothetical protein